MNTASQSTYRRSPNEIDRLVVTEGMTWAAAKSLVVMTELLQAYAKRVCAFNGHKWIDDSSGGPESGCIAMHCGRCGYSVHHRLY